MAEDDDVRTRLLTAMPRLTPTGLRVARVILDDPPGAAQLTVNQLAERADTSTSAVVRLAKTLGYDGYPQLRLALAAVGGEAGAAPVFATDIVADDPLGKVIHKLTAFETEGMVATADLADPATLTAVVEALVTARRIQALGIGASGLVATDLEQKLTRIGKWCRASTSEDDALVQTSLLEAEDVVIAFSHSGETGAIVEAVRRVGTRATTVAVTASPQSRLARAAAHTILVAGREDGFRSAAMASRMSQLLVVDALYIGVLQRTPSAALALRRTHDAVADRRSKEA
ncbi:MurR/RpiR family transcriptional regulator [Nocardia sp. CDC159]|uniref:MurR/RpiR family transcriptional regulator n=1 Tax=Nocardia pulmonis TaxID=2951408 RepID=A0A9X2EBH1_9NOCA|nr:MULTISPECIES: MurR/RpiR family transcriptional regulator [Nocardia]MCM6776415.1 MurR/RpiR family transcriptional regulator [Nocardia pulmonis]MCM6788839.1 MurR/RpiR family transcriptional regulator [Nocardia sp. CDC159]